MYVTSTLMLSIAGRMLERYSARWLFTGNAALMGATFLAMGFFNNVWEFYIAGGVLGVTLAFLLYLSFPTLVNRWFHSKVGLIDRNPAWRSLRHRRDAFQSYGRLDDSRMGMAMGIWCVRRHNYCRCNAASWVASSRPPFRHRASAIRDSRSRREQKRRAGRGQDIFRGGSQPTFLWAHIVRLCHDGHLHAQSVYSRLCDRPRFLA